MIWEACCTISGSPRLILASVVPPPETASTEFSLRLGEATLRSTCPGSPHGHVPHTGRELGSVQALARSSKPVGWEGMSVTHQPERS